MNNTIKEVADLAKEIGQDEIQGEDIRGFAGKMITFTAVKSDGYYEPLHDITYFWPEDRSCGTLRDSNNGWEWLGMCGCDWTREDIRNAVRNDQSLDDDAAEKEADEICVALGIAVET